MAQMPIHSKVKVKHIVASINILHMENTLFIFITFYIIFIIIINYYDNNNNYYHNKLL